MASYNGLFQWNRFLKYPFYVSNLCADWKYVELSEFNFYIYVSVREIDPWLFITSHLLNVLAIFVFLQYLIHRILLSIYTRLLVRSFHSVHFSVSRKLNESLFFFNYSRTSGHGRSLSRSNRFTKTVSEQTNVSDDKRCLERRTRKPVKIVQNGMMGFGKISSTPKH